MKGKKNFWILLCGMAVSEVGTYIYDFAASWVILERTSSAFMMVMYLAVGMVGRIVLGPIVSVYIEKANKKNLVVCLDFILALLMAFLALIESALSIMQFEAVFCCASFLISCISSAYAPSFGFLFKEGVPEDYLHKGNAARSIVNNCDSLGGIVLGGVLIRFLTFKTVLLINAVSYFMSAVSEIFISYKSEPKKITESVQFKADFLEGIRSYLQNSSVRRTTGIIAFFNFLNYGLYNVALEFLFNQVWKTSSTTYSAINAAMIMATIASSMLIVAKRKFNVDKNIKIGFLSSTVCSELLILAVLVCLFIEPKIRTITVACSIILVLSGITDSIIDISFETYIQQKVGKDVYIRNVTLIYTLLEIFSPVSAIVSGVLLEVADIKLFLGIFGAGYLIFGLGFLKKEKKEPKN